MRLASPVESETDTGWTMLAVRRLISIATGWIVETVSDTLINVRAMSPSALRSAGRCCSSPWTKSYRSRRVVDPSSRVIVV